MSSISCIQSGGGMSSTSCIHSGGSACLHLGLMGSRSSDSRRVELRARTPRSEFAFPRDRLRFPVQLLSLRAGAYQSPPSLSQASLMPGLSVLAVPLRHAGLSAFLSQSHDVGVHSAYSSIEYSSPFFLRRARRIEGVNELAAVLGQSAGGIFVDIRRKTQPALRVPFCSQTDFHPLQIEALLGIMLGGTVHVHLVGIIEAKVIRAELLGFKKVCLENLPLQR
jgi:hypothetical protein